MKTGLVLEGGALRTIFSSGVCDAFPPVLPTVSAISPASPAAT